MLEQPTHKQPNSKIITGINSTPEELKEVLDNEEAGRFFDFYFKPKFFEKSCRIYEILGVRLAKDMMMKLAKKSIFKKSAAHESMQNGGYSNYYLGPERRVADMMTFEKHTRKNEVAHLIGSIASITGLSAALTMADSEEHKLLLILLCFPTAVGNGLAYLIQRLNRARIYNTLDALKKEA